MFKCRKKNRTKLAWENLNYQHDKLVRLKLTIFLDVIDLNINLKNCLLSTTKKT